MRHQCDAFISADDETDPFVQEEMNKMQDVMEDLDMEYGVRMAAHGCLLPCGH